MMRVGPLCPPSFGTKYHGAPQRGFQEYLLFASVTEEMTLRATFPPIFFVENHMGKDSCIDQLSRIAYMNTDDPSQPGVDRSI